MAPNLTLMTFGPNWNLEYRYAVALLCDMLYLLLILSHSVALKVLNMTISE